MNPQHPAFLLPLVLSNSSPNNPRTAALQMSQSPPNNNNDPRFSRFPEFTPTPGNRAVQDLLLREVTWQVTRLATTETFETTIQAELSTVSDLVADLHLRSERDIRERNEELMRRESMESMSRWNQKLIEGSRLSKKYQMEICKELAVVDALIKRNDRRRRRRRKAQGKRVERSGAGVVFTAVILGAVMSGFEEVVRQEDGPASLARLAVGAVVVVFFAAGINGDGKRRE